MNTRNKQGASKLDELNLVWKTTGRKPPELEAQPQIDSIFNEAWSWFLQLHNKRQSSGMGINPLSWSDINAYFSLHKIEPMDYELFAIDVFDSAYMEVASKEMERQQKASTKKK